MNTFSISNQLVLTLVITHLDYANAILIGTTEQNLNRLQRIQNLAAKVVCNKLKREDSASACLKELHWIPVRGRIEYKVLNLVLGTRIP